MSANSSQCTGTSELHLHPHHLLCLQTFIGRGYSEEFIEHMTLVKRQLTTNPRTPIMLVSGADDLCAYCPNCVEGQCTSEKPALYDRLVRDKLGQNTPSFLIGIPIDLRITEDLIAACCPECEWKDLCLTTQSRKAPL